MELVQSLLGQSDGRLMIGIKPEKGIFFHKPAYTPEQVESIASQYSDRYDVYISCAVFDDSGCRKKENAIESNAFWVDIDCGLGKPYPTKSDGRNGLSEFLKVTGLPQPTHVIDSGNGLHVYWTLDKAISRTEWEQHAVKLKQLTHTYAFHVDDSRTSDIASVLRVPGTLNHKDRANPKSVVCKKSSDPIPACSFIDPLKKAYQKLGAKEVVPRETGSKQAAALLQYMAEKEPRLHAGIWELSENDLGTVGYPSQSEADYAYLGRCVRRAAEMGIPKGEIEPIVVEVFRGCNLYREAKEHTLEAAVSKLLVDIPDERPINTPLVPLIGFSLGSGTIELTDKLPPPRDWVVEGLFLAGKSAILGGAGGVSKTQLALQLLVNVTLGKPIFGRTVSSGKTLAFLGEDDREETSRRINAHAKTMHLSPAEKNALVDGARVFPMIGQDTRFAKPMSGALESTGIAEEIVKVSREFAQMDATPVRLIVLDHAGLLHGGDFNAREDVVQTMNLVNYIAANTGAAVILLAHTSKSAARKDDEASADDIAGNAAWVDLSRCVLMLRTMTDTESRKFGIAAEFRKQYASLNTVKSNYAAIGDTIWLERRSVDGYSVGVLDQVDLKPVDKSKATNGSDMKLRARIKELVVEIAGLTKNKIANYAGKDNRLKASRASVQAEVDQMLMDGSLILEAPSGEEKKRLGINAKTSGLLRVTKG